ncbi:MAG: cytochrome P450 [Acidobacteriota bacterium]
MIGLALEHPVDSTSVASAPGPRGLPVLGSFFEARRDPLGFLAREAERHGPLVSFRLGPYRFLLVASPDGVRHVCVENFRNYVKGPGWDGLRHFLGQGLLTSDGDLWQRQRRLAQPAFHRERLGRLVDQMVGATTERLLAWHDAAGVDVLAEMMRLTLSIVSRTMFGIDVAEQSRAIGPALGVALKYASDAADTPVPIPLWVPTPGNVQFKRAVRTLDDTVLAIIHGRKDGADRGDLLSLLMAARDEETGEGMSEKQLRDEVMTIVMAGHETTANALSWAFFLLARHPDVAARVAAEADEVIGDGVPSLENLPRLRYASMVFQETLRLYPPVWLTDRRAIADDRISGFDVPAGSIVALSPWVMHHLPRLWPDPERFDPERFAPERVAERDRYVYLPFGVGPRQCIGNHFAMMEAAIILAMVARRFRLSLAPGQTVDPEPYATLRPRHGLPMKLARRVG